jgi:hypothetical protein
VPRTRILLIFAGALIAGALLSPPPALAAAAAAPKCKVAEVNPVTGNAVCVDPIGAPVPDPPADLVDPCNSSHRFDPDFSFGPTCRTVPKSGS